ncbi:MAG: flavodoxin [Thermoproteota archaeon]|nr:flavodoxin [Thermoproteota archaeon]
MKILNVYYSMTGNTAKVALKIDVAARELGYSVETVKIDRSDVVLDLLGSDYVFAGSGVYGQLPGEHLVGSFRRTMQEYSKNGEVKPCSPRRPRGKAIVYCTYGGVHTGINEAVPTVKLMGQFFDHLGYTIVAEWYFVGEYNLERQREHSLIGRLGDIRGRPNEKDLLEVAEQTKGILKT